MRRLLALVLVLGLASVANAGLMLSVNGEPAPDEITLAPSDSIILDIQVMDGTELGGFDLAVQMQGPGSLDPANVVFEQTPNTRQYFGAPFNMWVTDVRAWGSGDVATIDASADALRISAGNLDFNTVGPYTLMDGLLFHCEGEGDVLIELIALDTTVYTLIEEGEGVGTIDGVGQIYDAGAVVDSILIHQIPEPMTLSLLAMGGLALLRRRR